MKGNFHTPVLLHEVVNGLNVKPGGHYIDATIGGGGHAWEIIKRGGLLLGIDEDKEAVEFARQRLKREHLDYKIVQGNFFDIETIAKQNGFDTADGILFDLGVSSYQLDTPPRGFSYRFASAPLDLRFDQSKGKTAADIINILSEDELYEIFSRYGEEQLARPVARALVRSRRMKPILTAGDVVSVVQTALGRLRPAEGVLSRVFQALRIRVNNELSSLRNGLSGADHLLVPGGRLAVISFHSLEDRIVKQFFATGHFRLITKKPVLPTRSEISTNIRSRSARLRIAERI